MSPHVAIVGAYGSAGVATADELLDRDAMGEIDDLELTLIDDGDPGGGLCILRGCMPSKDVLSAAEHRYRARTDDRLSGTTTADPQRVVDRKDDHVASFAEHRREHVHDIADREGVEFVHERARFVDDRTLAVGDRELDPDYVVVATGSVPSVPDLPGMESVDPLTSADVLDATEFPDSAVVMGFGYIGLELVPYLAEVGGVDVTVIEHDARPLSDMESAFGETILEIYRERFGIEILTGTDETSVEATDDGVRLRVEREGGEEAIEADRLYTFTGREPDLAGLGLEHTALDPGEGWVGSTMQAGGDDRVFVVGDANGREPILHVAKEQGFTAGENVVRHARGEELRSYANVPHHVIFSGLGVYPFARIGHTPATVAETEMDAIVVSREAASDGVFAVKGAPEGRATLIVNDDGTVLGYQGLHYQADAMAKTMQVVIETGVDVREVPKRAYHPTTPEILDGLFREACAELGDRQPCVGPVDSPDIGF